MTLKWTSSDTDRNPWIETEIQYQPKTIARGGIEWHIDTKQLVWHSEPDQSLAESIEHLPKNWTFA